MSKRYVWIIVAVLLALVALAMVRFPAKSQEIVVTAPEALLRTAADNLAPYGYRVQFESTGSVESVETALNLLMGDDEFFVVAGVVGPDDPEDDGAGLVTVGEVVESADGGRGDIEAARTLFSESIREGDRLYQVFVNGRRGHIVVSEDATRTAGFFTLVSRIGMASYRHSPGGAVTRMQRCAAKTLSLDVFGRPAETISVCGRAYCPMGADNDCLVWDTETASGLFGYVDYAPEDLPAPAWRRGASCTAAVRYEWGVRLGSLTIFDYAFAADGASVTNKGYVASEVVCQK